MAEVEYHDHTSPSIWVRFRLTSDPAKISPWLAGREVYGLIWTTTPWTIPANMAIAFHHRFEYGDGAPIAQVTQTKLHRIDTGGDAQPTAGPVLLQHGTGVRANLFYGSPTPRSIVDVLVAEGYDVVVTTGGTGLTPTDRTPEMTRRVLDTEIPGIADAIRAAGAGAVPAAILSRGLAGVAGRTLLVNLPGSSGGVRDGMAVLAPVLVHAVDQIRGGDHPREG